MASELPDRENIKDEYKWNLDDIYDSVEEWEKDLDKVEKLLKNIKEYENELTESDEKLYQAINLLMKIEKINSKLYTYAHLAQDQDTRNQKYQEIFMRAQDIYNKTENVVSFIKPELIRLEETELKNFLQEHTKLNKYKKYLYDIFSKKDHYLSKPEENLLGLSQNVTDSFMNIFNMLNDADLSFPEIENEKGEKVRLTHGRYSKFMESQDRNVRKRAFQALYNKYKEFKNTFASTLSSKLKSDIFYAKARKYESSLAAALDQNNIPVEVYSNLIDTVKDNLTVFHKYISLRKNLLDVDNLHMYDIYVPLMDKDIHLSFDKSKKIIIEALKPLGKEYIEIVKKAFKSGWIDVYENKGKRSGAYSSGCYEVHPYILLNYNENINSLFTLAHELGHALHSYFSSKSQPYVYADYKIFLAEIASTLNECLLVNYLIENTKDDLEKRLYLNHFLEAFRVTVFRQTKFAEFEKIIHTKSENNIPLTSKKLNEIYYNLTKKYYDKNI
ncbi:MAG: oligoendopeptidase F, partial [Bacillota bacterium]